MEIKDKGYVNPDILVSTQWVANHLKDSNIRIVESDEDPLLYTSGHIPEAVEVDWTKDLNDQIRRDYITKNDFEDLASRIGITKDTTVIFYGDKNNWWACYAFWVFQLFGHTKAKVIDGGRIKWDQEKRPLTRDIPEITKTKYISSERDDSKIRAFREQVLMHIKSKKPLIDVRSPDEYSGKKLHMEGYPNEGALRGGHIPGAKSVPWSKAVNSDGTFKTSDELKALYMKEVGLKITDEVIAYCRIGERSSHTWFVLKYLLGFPNVRNYDGSWTEWGNLVGVPIEK